MLSDGHALYTPGLSENRAGVSGYYSNDRQGNLWTIDGSGKTQTNYEDFSGFGTLIAGGSLGSPFGYGGRNGCQTDADTGLVLMGHRYYDTRQGRFISQDPAHNGSNWYKYVGNSPTNGIDPMGLKQVQPDDDQTQQILAAIAMMREAGYTEEADQTQQMLKQGRLLVDDSNPSGEEAGSSTDLFHISHNTVTIFIYQQSFAPNYGVATPTARFGDNVALSATLVHENLHALHQGVAFKIFYPSAIEPHAYGKELHYLHALQNHAKNPGQLAAIEFKIESLAIPTEPSFSDKFWDGVNTAADTIDNSN